MRPWFRAEIHLSSDYSRQFLFISEVTEANAFERARLEFRQHVHVAFGTEIGARHRPEQRQLADAVLAAERREAASNTFDGESAAGRVYL